MPEPASSLLAFVELAQPPYSLRGITEQIELIPQATNLRRDVNGVLHDVGSPDFRQYRITVQCRDQQSPGLDDVWPGRELTMHAASEFSTQGASDSDGFARPPVSGSVRTEGDFIFYRPIFLVKVIEYRTEFEEYEAGLSWELVLEERQPTA